MKKAFKIALIFHVIAFGALGISGVIPSCEKEEKHVFQLVAAPSPAQQMTIPQTAPAVKAIAQPAMPKPVKPLPKAKPLEKIKPNPKPTVKPKPKPVVKPKPVIKPVQKKININDFRKTQPKPKPKVKPKPKPKAKAMTAAEFQKQFGVKPTPAPTPAPQRTAPAPQPIVIPDIISATRSSLNESVRNNATPVTSSRTTTRRVSDRQMAQYGQRIKQMIESNWSTTEILAKGDLKAVVRFTVAANGLLMNATIIQSSGDKNFDRTLISAFNRTRQVERPPDGKSGSYTLGFGLQLQ